VQASLHNWDGALSDAKKAVELKPDWSKGYSRLGGALFGLGNHEEAADAYKKGLAIDPTNGPLKDGLKEAEKALAGRTHSYTHSFQSYFSILHIPNVQIYSQYSDVF
jgi:stress-induced-phosphoprotein 1